MKLVSATTNGNQAGVVWLNDHNTRTSKLVNAADLSDICGFDVKGYKNLAELNSDLYGFEFTTAPEYGFEFTAPDGVTLDICIDTKTVGVGNGDRFDFLHFGSEKGDTLIETAILALEWYNEQQ